jgi:hypothetical protein
MFNHSPKIISLVWAVPLLLCLCVTESKAAINKTIIENTSSSAIAALEPKAIASSCSQGQPLDDRNFITGNNNEVLTSAVVRENRTKITKISSDKLAQELQLLIAARPDQQTKKCRVLGDC